MLNSSLEPGKYVLAISGGVDSVSLLHILQNLNERDNSTGKYSFTVAHFDHGIREDSAYDRRLVAKLAQQYRLPFVYQNGNLGAGASEELARNARYDFLKDVQKTVKADAIVTAHHQDDVIETAVFNLLRGTGRKGMSSLADKPHVRRPLLHVNKVDIQAYAKEQGLVWHEDSTNSDTTITRNYIRNVLLPRIGPQGRAALLDAINHIKVLNKAIDDDLLVYLHAQPSRQALDRHMFTLLPHTVAKEVMASWLRSHGIAEFDTRMLERLVAQCKTLIPGKQIDIDARHCILIGRESLVLTKRST
ncbi:MAG: tRNA(Ile)-lysidine synthase [Patescibacteria group bacterium]|nr:tRNA(Ile)-lysidine synthase [Patescibacteria group bacterium]